jgi:hypothetical protein
MDKILISSVSPLRFNNFEQIRQAIRDELFTIEEIKDFVFLINENNLLQLAAKLGSVEDVK